MHLTLSDVITDITQNAVESGASRVELSVSETRTADGKAEFRFRVTDNGRGMTAEELKRAKDPFYTDGEKHPGRKVGLGIPFLIQTAEASGGGTEIDSEKGKGTSVVAWFDMNNVDTPPVGDVPGMFRAIMMFPGSAEVVISRIVKDGKRDIDYTVTRSELSEALGGLEDSSSLALLGEYLRSQEESE
jgi:hypothetical protein